VNGKWQIAKGKGQMANLVWLMRTRAVHLPSVMCYVASVICNLPFAICHEEDALSSILLRSPWIPAPRECRHDSGEVGRLYRFGKMRLVAGEERTGTVSL
jgi:hypothetical protein